MTAYSHVPESRKSGGRPDVATILCISACGMEKAMRDILVEAIDCPHGSQPLFFVFSGQNIRIVTINQPPVFP